ncbi:hypothetical protein ACET3Z_020760 [Daucus carota]
MASAPSQTNFQRLLRALTPTVRPRPIPKAYVEGWNKTWNPLGQPITQYYSLGDLWYSFEKWSACGTGTRIENPGGEDVMHYFVPKLSAIQIFTTKSLDKLRILKIKDIKDIDGLEAELWSDESDGEKSSGSPSNDSSNAWEVTADDWGNDYEDPPLYRRNFRNLYFGAEDTTSPYFRAPLFEKIFEATVQYPGLMTLKSTDLTPASWIAISWYPIYQVAAHEVKDDMASPFLTFHTLSSFFIDAADVTADAISLPPFGIASYRLEGDIWFGSEQADYLKFYDLHRAADSWLKQVHFNHYDFKFFNKKADHDCNADCPCRRYGNYHKDF